MNLKNTHSPVSSLFSKQLNLSDFGFEKPLLKKIKEINNDIKPNKLLKFIKYVFEGGRQYYSGEVLKEL